MASVGVANVLPVSLFTALITGSPTICANAPAPAPAIAPGIAPTPAKGAPIAAPNAAPPAIGAKPRAAPAAMSCIMLGSCTSCAGACSGVLDRICATRAFKSAESGCTSSGMLLMVMPSLVVIEYGISIIYGYVTLTCRWCCRYFIIRCCCSTRS